MCGEGLGRIAVISDCHFGDPGALLTSEEMAGELFAELGRAGDIEMLVLLGDIWDLWCAGFGAAVSAGTPFFRALAAWDMPRENVLVIGNHDYHLWTACEERRARQKLGWEEMEEITISLDPGYAGSEGVCLVRELPLWMHYPFLHVEVRGRSVLLMHGHHLDFFSRSFWWAKTAWLARGVLGRSRGLGLSDIDRLNRPFFELLYQRGAEHGRGRGTAARLPARIHPRSLRLRAYPPRRVLPHQGGRAVAAHGQQRMLG